MSEDRGRPFILLEKLASGGMADVYLAKLPGANDIGQLVAVKCIADSYTKDKKFISMFKDEARITVNLNQSNIAQVFEFCEMDNHYYLVMEYLQGKNLREVMKQFAQQKSGFTISQAIFVVQQVADGLDYAHTAVDRDSQKPLSVIHRDINPRNIMLTYSGEVKIIDFGIAKAIVNLNMEITEAGQKRGKLAYMSPEQLEGTTIDSRTDIFSLGIVLWEILTGRKLFSGEDRAEIIRKIRQCEVPPVREANPYIEEALEKIVMKSLEKNPDDRYQTAAQFSDDLLRFLNRIEPGFSHRSLASSLKESFQAELKEENMRAQQRSHIMFPMPEKPAPPQKVPTVTIKNHIPAPELVRTKMKDYYVPLATRAIEEEVARKSTARWKKKKLKQRSSFSFAISDRDKKFAFFVVLLFVLHHYYGLNKIPALVASYINASVQQGEKMMQVQQVHPVNNGRSTASSTGVNQNPAPAATNSGGEPPTTWAPTTPRTTKGNR